MLKDKKYYNMIIKKRNTQIHENYNKYYKNRYIISVLELEIIKNREILDEDTDLKTRIKIESNIDYFNESISTLYNRNNNILLNINKLKTRRNHSVEKLLELYNNK